MTYHLSKDIEQQFNIFDARLTEDGADYRRERGIYNKSMFGPLPENFLPKIIHANPRKNSKLHDFIEVSTGHIVSEKFRLLVESFEPDVHQFHPIELIREKGELEQKHYYFFPCQQIECVFPDGEPGFSIVWEERKKFPDEKKVPNIAGTFKSRIAKISKQAVVGKHLWVPRSCGEGLLVSNDFMAAFEAQKLTGGWFHECLDVDLPYDREEVLKDILAFRRKYGLPEQA